MSLRWLYYRIFADPSDQLWYYKLLVQVVNPFIDKNEPLIERFFFFHYFPKYEPEDECESKFTTNDSVAFVRLRVLAQSANLPVLENSLLDLIRRSSAVKEIERCKKYDVNRDIGTRFGTKCVSAVIDYLDVGSRLTLALLEGEGGFSPKVADAVHLVCNMMDFRLRISRANMEQFLKQQSGDLIIMP
jgi:hypothetical protein